MSLKECGFICSHALLALFFALISFLTTLIAALVKLTVT